MGQQEQHAGGGEGAHGTGMGNEQNKEVNPGVRA